MVSTAPTMVSVSSRPKQRKHANRHEDVVQQRDNGAHGERKFEAKGHENQDAENAEPERDQRASCQLAADERADAFRAFHFKLGVRHRCMICFSTLSLVFNGVRTVM